METSLNFFLAIMQYSNVFNIYCNSVITKVIIIIDFSFNIFIKIIIFFSILFIMKYRISLFLFFLQ